VLKGFEKKGSMRELIKKGVAKEVLKRGQTIRKREGA